MSLCINNDLIWVSVPRCASKSIELSLLQSELDTNHYVYGKTNDAEKHAHIPIDTLYKKFGLKESVCIKRDYVDRWMSSIRLFWDNMRDNNLEPIIEWEDIDNQFIYKNFNKEYIDDIHNANPIALEIGDSAFNDEYIRKLNNHFLKTKNNKLIEYNSLYHVFYSQSFWTKNKKCTYEFDIKNISEFEKFIRNRYAIDFKLQHINESTKIPNKIVIDGDFRNWIFNNFEKRFIKTGSII